MLGHHIRESIEIAKEPLEYESQTEDAESRFADVAEAEVEEEGVVDEEVDSVEIRREVYNSNGVKM